MSGNEKKREQAERLLRSLTDIDDRYLEEAMGQGMAEEQQIPGTDGLPEQSPENSTKVESIAAGRKKNIRRYSRWALTAAACLTVVLVGRYVTLHQKANQSVEKSEIDYVESEETYDAMESALPADERSEEPAVTADGKPEEAAVMTDGKSEEPAVTADTKSEEPAVTADAKSEKAAEEAAPEAASQEVDASAEDMDMEAAVEISDEMAAGALPAEDSEPVNAAPSALSEEKEEIMDAGTAYESAQIANPWIDAETLEEAEDLAGLKMSVPEAYRPYTETVYRAIKDGMLEVIFLDKAEKEGYRIRKAAGEDDISGDYNEYAKEKKIKLKDGTEVTLRGEKEDSWSAAVWMAEDAENGTVYSYAVCSADKLFTTNEIREIAETMTNS